MSRTINQAATASVALSMTLLACGISTAQVGPSTENIRKVHPHKSTPTKARPPRHKSHPSAGPVVRVKPGKPVVQVKPVPPRHPGPAVVEKTGPKTPVVANLSPKAVAARKWLTDEKSSLQTLSKAAEGLTAPKVGAVRYPVQPKVPTKIEPDYLYLQRVTLRVLREDGKPTDPRLVHLASGAFKTTYGEDHLELEGPRVSSDPALELPAGWTFVNSADSHLGLNSFPGEEMRSNLPPRVEKGKPQIVPESPLFQNEQEKAALRSATGKLPLVPNGKKPLSTYPTPAALGLDGVTRLVEARRLLDESIPVPAEASREDRLKAWVQFDQAIRLLGQADLSLRMEARAAEQLKASNTPKQLLGPAYHIDYGRLQALIASARVRRSQYLAEAQWWQAQCERPVRPDRSRALQTLRDAQNAASQNSELAAQLSRLDDVASHEAAIDARSRSGDFGDRVVPQVQVVHHTIRTVKLARNVVDLRIPSTEVMDSDVLTLVGDNAQKIAFHHDGAYYRATVDRNLVKKGQLLRLDRKNRNSVMQADCRIEDADPYNLAGNDVSRSGLRLLGISSYTIGDGAQPVSLFEELEAVDRSGAKLAVARRKAVREATFGEDGSWWVPSDSGPFSYRLRPSPYPGRRSEDGVEEKLASFVRKIRGRDDDRNRRLLDPVIVDAIRLEGESAGSVAGVHVGSKQIAVEDALGGSIPANGLVRYLDGGLELGMRDGVVSYIQVGRRLDDLVGKPAPRLSPGAVTQIQYDANRLKVRVGPGFQPVPGTELELTVAGREIPTEPGGKTVRAVVLDMAGSEAVCKLVRKDRSGKITSDADRWTLWSLPPGESGAVKLKLAGG